ncbi:MULTISPECIES: hypothetical protein [Flavobacteriaceae]|uniref:hypothetical protein n=1 Tax=Flavobacteriaceae TaxID=49546 RepID=UPI0023499FC3|nr:hypothetical protein [Muricauda sp. SP22]MDC6361857.1 hypothetical protein [Muricauda sp. SP22]
MDWTTLVMGVLKLFKDGNAIILCTGVIAAIGIYIGTSVKEKEIRRQSQAEIEGLEAKIDEKTEDIKQLTIEKNDLLEALNENQIGFNSVQKQFSQILNTYGKEQKKIFYSSIVLSVKFESEADFITKEVKTEKGAIDVVDDWLNLFSYTLQFFRKEGNEPYASFSLLDKVFEDKRFLATMTQNNTYAYLDLTQRDEKSPSAFYVNFWFDIEKGSIVDKINQGDIVRLKKDCIHHKEGKGTVLSSKPHLGYSVNPVESELRNQYGIKYSLVYKDSGFDTDPVMHYFDFEIID